MLLSTLVNDVCPSLDSSVVSLDLFSTNPMLSSRSIAHLCPKCNDKRFARTSNLYRHMRTCKARPPQDTQSPVNKEKSTVQSHLSITNNLQGLGLGTATSLASSSSQVTPPTEPPSPTSPMSDVGFVRGISPDPSWGDVPLSGWKPSTRRHTLPASHPVPIAMQAHINESPILARHPITSSVDMPSPSSLLPLALPLDPASSSISLAPAGISWNVEDQNAELMVWQSSSIPQADSSGLTANYAQLQSNYQPMQTQEPPVTLRNNSSISSGVADLSFPLNADGRLDQNGAIKQEQNYQSYPLIPVPLATQYDPTLPFAPYSAVTAPVPRVAQSTQLVIALQRKSRIWPITRLISLWPNVTFIHGTSRKYNPTYRRQKCSYAGY